MPVTLSHYRELINTEKYSRLTCKSGSAPFKSQQGALLCLIASHWHMMLLLTLQASAEDHRHGAGVVPADLWDRSELSVPGRRWGGDAHAAELPELRPAAARLHDHSLHPQRSESESESETRVDGNNSQKVHYQEQHLTHHNSKLIL